MRKIELFGSDYELLKAGVPIPPCYECRKQRKECPNCEECEQYQISMKAFDAVGIGEIARLVAAIDYTRRKIGFYEADLQKYTSQLQECGVDINKLFGSDVQDTAKGKTAKQALG